MSQLKHIKLKLIMAGDHAVGKTSIVRRFMGKDFSPDIVATMGVECYTKSYKNESNIIDLAVWDLAGQIIYRDLTSGYIKGADLVIIVFDVTRRETYENVKGWYDSIFNIVDLQEKLDILPCMIIGNKIDLKDKREVTFDEGIAITEKLNTLYVETSAKQNTNIDVAFNNLILEYIRISQFF
ncbi:MAG: Rab family GTPase [Candidatus Helarchaeota archaeon]